MSSQALAIQYPHPRDAFIQFDEPSHQYTLLLSSPSSLSQNNLISVTTLIHTLFPKFNAEMVIQNMMKSVKWTTSPYFGMTTHEIQQQWSQEGKTSAQQGTAMHKAIELFYNGELTATQLLEMTNNQIELRYFLRFHFDHIVEKGILPYRTEWYVYDEEIQVAGSIDMVYANPTNLDELYIYDWKRVKEVKRENSYSHGFVPIEHLPDCNYSHYALQLNLYKYILEKKYGKTVKELYLVILHPTNPNNGYQIIPLPILTTEITSIVTMRLQAKSQT